VSIPAWSGSPHPGASRCIPPFPRQACIPTHIHPCINSIFFQGLLCLPPLCLPHTLPHSQWQALSSTAWQRPSTLTQTRHGTWGWHMASSWDHALPVSSCSEAHCQLQEGASLFFRGTSGSGCPQGDRPHHPPMWQADGGCAGVQLALVGPHGPSPICPAQLLALLVRLGIMFQVPLTWWKQIHRRANCFFQH